VRCDTVASHEQHSIARGAQPEYDGAHDIDADLELIAVSQRNYGRSQKLTSGQSEVTSRTASSEVVSIHPVCSTSRGRYGHVLAARRRLGNARVNWLAADGN
jgi:hypothetical protein